MAKQVRIRVNNNAKPKKNKSKDKSIMKLMNNNSGRGTQKSAPSALFRELRNFFTMSSPTSLRGNAIIIKGQDYVGSIAVAASTPVATNLMDILLVPIGGAFEGTRLELLARCFEKYCFKKFKVHVQSSNPTAQVGSYIVAYDRDAGDSTPPANDGGLKSYMAMDGARMGALWESVSIECPLTDTQDFFYTNQLVGEGGYVGDIRMSMQGQVYVSTGPGTTGSTPANLGVWIEYECLLMDPQLESGFQGKVDGVASDSTVTTSATVNTGLNSYTNGDLTKAQGSVPIKFETIPNGYTGAGNIGLFLPSGWYELEQYIENASAAVNMVAPGLVAVLASQSSQVIATSLNLVQPNGAGDNGTRVDKLYIPTNGAWLLTSFSAAVTLSTYILRVISASKDLV